MSIQMVYYTHILRRKKMYPNIYTLLTMSQEELETDILLNVYYTYFSPSKYIIYRKNNEPKPLLCVHLDTINTTWGLDAAMTLDDLSLSRDGIVSLVKNSKMKCLGADDRAGVFIALSLIEWMEENNDYKYDVGFFWDEEIGGLGSAEYRVDFPTDNNTCYIGLDRRNAVPNEHEVALYDYDNEELTSIFNELGYKTVNGSFTDASNIANDKACVNLSVGYNHEHSTRETLHIPSMTYTLSVLRDLVLPTKLFYCEDREYVDYPYIQDDEFEMEILYEENKALRAYIRSINEDPDDIITRYYYT